MSIVWALIIGLGVGAVAKLLMPGKDPGGFIVTSLIGVTGSIIATFIGRALGWYRERSGCRAHSFDPRGDASAIYLPLFYSSNRTNLNL